MIINILDLHSLFFCATLQHQTRGNKNNDCQVIGLFGMSTTFNYLFVCQTRLTILNLRALTN
jgi:hypothetical protein